MQNAILQLVHQAHALSETAAVEATDPLERKKLILADLSLHLVQAALRQPQPQPAELRRYLFSILTLCDSFVPDLDLKALAEVVLPSQSGTSAPVQ
ncbi:hypothetical protein H8B13_14825 [Hymenobacter sp. BT188]|uniref:hypothetical protein n=1 Tax=Hymenobacter sp. BT188 TaxID=2763504 RepID=UPI0016516A8E|nr:hypothetical protein [Hymenobacter sp. BT188]MBC6608098.1 hypothetical protein [Hymenobacter sp. BT188]